ncbi:MAG: Crp/Fnr family transcriptional regulator [Polyangia bacterium]|jgi:CRP-like cAMP-binding protein
MATRETGQLYQDPKKALWCLKKLPLLADIPHDTLSQLADSVSLLDLRRRQVIYLPGDPGGAVYFLSSGRVKISKVTRDGKELTLDYRVAGDVFGELCLIEGGAREDMAEAMDQTLVIEVERGQFERLVQKEGLIGFRLVKVLAQRRRELEGKIENLIFKDVNSKLAELLLRLGQDYGVDDSRGTLVSLKITHQEMANLIGSTRETVSLTLSQFKRSGLIATDGRRVILSNQEGLRALA